MREKLDRWAFRAAALALVVLVLVSGWQLTKALAAYRREAAVKEEMQAYRPQSTPQEDNRAFHSPEVVVAKELNPDVTGWLTIPSTGVDYAFVASKDNRDYLRRNIHGEYAVAGTIFLDYRNNADFTDAKSILYGHNMKNGGMFGDLEKYKDAAFMKENGQGSIVLEDARYTFTIFACMEVSADDDVYLFPYTREDVEKSLARWQKTALQFAEPDWRKDSRLLVLSTCADDAGQTRLVVLARMEIV